MEVERFPFALHTSVLQTAVAALALTWVIYYAAFVRHTRCDPDLRSTPFPPGPKKAAFTGHLHLPRYDGRFNRLLGRIFGPVVRIAYGYSVNIFGLSGRPSNSTHEVILVNSSALAVQLLERKSGTYSSRARSIAAGKHLSQDKRLVLLPYDDTWKRHHRAFARLFGKDKINNTYRKALDQESLFLVQGLVACSDTDQRPVDGVTALTSRFTASSVLQIAYARRALSSHDQILKNLAKVSENIALASTPGAFWVETLPFLDILPMWISPWKRRLKEAHDFEMSINGGLVADVQRRITEVDDSIFDASSSRINVAECCTAQLLSARDTLRLDLDDIAYLAATVFEAGTETTAMTLNTFLLACICFPDFVPRARSEIDRVLSAYQILDQSVPKLSANLPSFDHMEQMPYVRAVIRETLRFTPTGSTGVAHISTSVRDDDIEYEDPNGARIRYRIPAECTVLPNIYGIHHDAALYPDPYRFRPERFLPSGLGAGQSPPINARGQRGSSSDLTAGHHAFGFGRRICPGLDLASNSLFISVSRILACLDIQPTSFAKERAQALREEDRRWREGWKCKIRALCDKESAALDAIIDESELERQGHPYLAPLLDAYNTFRLSKEDFEKCLRIAVRNPERLRTVETSLARV